ncbi:TonB-dependent siderophore receptor [Malaciobacter sp. WC5094]
MKIKYFQNKLSITLCTLLLTGTTLFANEANKDNKKEETKKLDTVTIIGQDDSSYVNYEKPSITRGNIETEDMSRSVQVFNSSFIENYQAKDIWELPSLSSNVTYGGHNRSRGINFNIRGFKNDSVLRDGLAIPNAIPNTDIYNIERIEILKGPDSIQFGQSNPGGLINFVKKKPLREEHAEFVLEVNDNVSISPKVDFGGLITDKLSYRVVASYTQDETFKEFTNDFKRVFVAPTLRYDINDNNSIDLILEVNNEDKPYDFGAISYSTKGELLHNRKYPISNPVDLSTRDQTTYGFDYNNTIGSFESTFRYRHVGYDFDLPAAMHPESVNENTKVVRGSYAEMFWHNKADIYQYTLAHKYEDDTFKNNFNFGLDYVKSQQDQYTAFTGWPGTVYQDFDLKNGTYPVEHPSRPTGMVTFGGTKNGVDTSKQKGIFIQNSLTINDSFIINSGLRYDKVDKQSREGSAQNYDKDNLTPQLGFVYKINSDSSVYLNYSESFKAQDTQDKNGNFLEPEVGKGYELGLRQSLFEDNLHLTTSVFKIEKENVAINYGTRFVSDYKASGKQESKGFEIDLGGNITDDFAVLASYGYVKTKDDNGKKFDNVAKHTANIYGTYRINKIYLSGGLQYVGDRYYGDVKYKSHLVSNANISYKESNWTANLGVKNLTDEIYFSSVNTRPGASTIGTPRTIYANISYKF